MPFEGHMPSRILDLLETDGGWFTKHTISDRLRAEVDHTKRTLYRLRERGLVVSRPAPWSKHPVVNEWRAA
jgi:transcription initiation factor IIE alpha subunit